MSTARRCSSCWDSRAPVHMGKGPATGRNSIGEVPTAQPALGDRNPIIYGLHGRRGEALNDENVPVDGPVVVALGEEAEFVVGVGQGQVGQGGDQIMLVGADVLALVHQYPAKSRQLPRSPLVGLVGLQAVAVQQGRGLAEHILEIALVQRVGT